MLRTLPCHCCSPPRGTTHHRLLRLQPLYPSRPCRYIAPPQCSGRDSEKPGSQRPTPRQPDTTHVQFPEAVAARWRQLDPPQRVYAVAVALLLILAVPRAITLAVLLAERVLVGGLLVTEELLLGLLLKSAALAGIIAAALLVVGGWYLFGRRRPERGGGGDDNDNSDR